jgi:hypothetical protein
MGDRHLHHGPKFVIMSVLTVKSLFRLAGRQATGLIRSLLIEGRYMTDVVKYPHIVG